MNTPSPSHLQPGHYHLLQQHLTTWQESDSRRPSIYNMPAEVTEALAAANIYTTTLGISDADKPLAADAYLAQKGYELELSVIARNMNAAYEQSPEFKQAARTDEFGHNNLGPVLAETFRAVTAITAHNVHVVKPRKTKGKIVDGTVVAERMIFNAPSPEQSQRLLCALQPIMQTISGDICPVRPYFDENWHMVGAEVLGLNEHMARSLSRGLESLMAESDRYRYGIELPLRTVSSEGEVQEHPTAKQRMRVLPNQKLSYVEWKKAGETFHPEIEQRLQVADREYKDLTLKASYDGDDILQPVTTNKNPDYHLLGTDAAGMLQGMRDIFNVRIVTLRKGPHRNPEQDPDKASRLRIDANTNLTRDKVDAEQVARGPVMGRPVNPRERLGQSGREFSQKVKSDPAGSSIEAIEFVTHLEPIKLAFTGVKFVRSRHKAKRSRGVKTDPVKAHLHERKQRQNPNYLLDRLSWLVNIGGHFNLSAEGKLQLEALRRQDAQPKALPTAESDPDK